MEKAEIFADHLTRLNVVHIQAGLAATTVRETLEYEVCNSIAMATTASLDHLLKETKSAFIVFLGTVLRAVGKNHMPVIVQPVPRTVPPPPYSPHAWAMQHHSGSCLKWLWTLPPTGNAVWQGSSTWS